jgi:long-chain-fatty-acid--[acyl-carrier-protein] ligase
LLPLVAGIRAAYYPDPTNGPALAREIELWSATLICAAPTFLKTIFKAATVEQLKTVRLCVSGAEKTPPELILLAKQKIPQTMLTEGYGITECSPVLTINLNGDPQHGVGIPIPGVDVCIVDLNTYELLPGLQRGLILARGPSIFSGYLNPGINSPFVTVSGLQWYNTGDLGYLDEQGNLILAGRLKRFIKVGPEMISLGAIEEALMHKVLYKHVNGHEPEGPSLAICAKEESGEKPLIVLVTKFPTTVDEANNTLKESGFSNLVRIGQVVQMEEIPLLGTGKINYRSLEAQVFPNP